MTKNSICFSFISNKTSHDNLQRDPFGMEKFRSTLVTKRKFEDLKKTYGHELPQLENVNTSNFWDDLFEEQVNVGKNLIVKDRIKTVLRMISNLEGRLLDVGFGFGYIEKVLNEKKRFELFGVDISKRVVAGLKKEVDGDFKKGSILKLPYGDNFFDVVLALEILEHVSPRNTFKAIGELYRVLKDKGFLIVSVPLNEDLEAKIRKGVNISGHVRIYTPNLVKAELQIGGFEILEEKTLFAFRNYYFLKDFLRRFLFKDRWKPNGIVVLSKK